METIGSLFCLHSKYPRPLGDKQMKTIQHLISILLLSATVAFSGLAHASTSTKPVPFNQTGFDKYKGTLYKVSQQSGESATTLAAYMSMESNFRANVCNSAGSGACGATQFIPGTWKAMVKKHHRKYGLSKNVSRSNAYANLAMTAEYIKYNRDVLKQALKRDVTTSEVYLAHLLGAGNAIKVLKANPNRKITSVISVHRGNNNLLYSKGKSITVAQFKANLQRKFTAHSSAYRPAVNNYALNQLSKEAGLDQLIAQVSVTRGVNTL